MEDVVFDDILEQILVRLAVKDIVLCKSVCKSWYSGISRSISCSAFVNSHMKHNNNNPVVGRIIMQGDYWKNKTTIGSRRIPVESSWRDYLVGSFVGDFHITIAYNSAGILCNGALHWLMADQNRNPVQHILSFHLSKDEFKEIPIPADHRCKVTDHTRLGIVEECLCIFDESSCDQPKWAMKNYNDTQS
uniref:F-box protein At3g07870-like n=1 Tax=Erigeron canadensis TaxID=72917 RepID=UPI001CB9751D|nr:F-box protein At3g07870-like [Erigeron canadensis]